MAAPRAASSGWQQQGYEACHQVRQSLSPPAFFFSQRLTGYPLLNTVAGRAAYGQAGDAQALSQAELLWGIIFTAAMEENRFDEALAAIRAEYDLWQDVDPDKADAAR